MKTSYDKPLNLGQTLFRLRKERGSTQQEVGEFVGVSKVAISKWENGLNLPDISSLPLLASYFNVSIDQLLGYEAQLSEEQAHSIYANLARTLGGASNDRVDQAGGKADSRQEQSAAPTPESARKVWTSVQALIKRYYSSPILLLSMGIFVLNHYDLLPGPHTMDHDRIYLERARELFARVRELSSDAKLIDRANKNEAYCLLLLRRPQDVLKLLGEHMDELFPGETLIASAQQQLGRTEDALETTQASIFQYATVLVSQLASYLPLIRSSSTAVIATAERGEALITTFRLEDLSPVIVLNFRLSLACAYADLGVTDGARQALQAYADLLATAAFPITRHGDEYFSRIDHWLETIGVDAPAPRLSGLYEQNMSLLPFRHPQLGGLLQTEPFAPLAAQLKTMKR
ncbi:helix-turn-helix domain-containing protein [Bifidobacterium xylocopae]|uniref:HTH cro/C1-type domain-containing protein n=1 Tax=Bifidobacterium xylocopae TaxID=2493119 RepID=A0A366KE44_9BIFI|nr:helix-turn-helix transcriptional regulator [Bifidobacterium xylocopae]RBP99383.1 hypothetical protein CRD59_04085 [Bifidobacterium xylocopae]